MRVARKSVRDQDRVTFGRVQRPVGFVRAIDRRKRDSAVEFQFIECDCGDLGDHRTGMLLVYKVGGTLILRAKALYPRTGAGLLPRGSWRRPPVSISRKRFWISSSQACLAPSSTS